MCIYSYISKLQSSSECFPFEAIHISIFFSTAHNSFWTGWFWCLLVLLPFFVSSFPHQNIFHPGKQKKKSRGEIGCIGRVGHGGHAILGQKLLNIQHSVGRCTCKSPIMKWANAFKESSKKFTEVECNLSQQCRLVHWYRWVPTTLT